MKNHNLIQELKDRLKLERGQTMSEYALVLTLISATSVLAFSSLSTAVRLAITSVVGLLP